MTQFEKFKNMDTEQFADWLDEYGMFDGSPWMEWFDRRYCNNCKPVMCHSADDSREFAFAWCEIYDKCKYFPESYEQPDNKEVIKMWLESEVDGEGANCQD